MKTQLYDDAPQMAPCQGHFAALRPSAYGCHQQPHWGGGEIKQQMSQHLILRPRSLHVDHPLGRNRGGWVVDVDCSGRRGGVTVGGVGGIWLAEVCGLWRHTLTELDTFCLPCLWGGGGICARSTCFLDPALR